MKITDQQKNWKSCLKILIWPAEESEVCFGLGSSEFTWSLRVSQVSLKDGGNPIFMGARLKVGIGIISSTDLSREGEAAHPRFPVVGIFTCSARTGRW